MWKEGLLDRELVAKNSEELISFTLRNLARIREQKPAEPRYEVAQHNTPQPHHCLDAASGLFEPGQRGPASLCTGPWDLTDPHTVGIQAASLLAIRAMLLVNTD